MNVDTVQSATDGRCILRPSWYCGQTTVGRERKLEAALARVGVETFLPLTRIHRQRHQYIHENREDDNKGYEKRSYTSGGAFFPGYIFAKMGEYEWTRVKLQLGVSVRAQWVNFGEGPVEVPAEFIDMLREGRVETNAADRREYPRIEAGQEVKIIDGPLSGFSGIFDQELSGGERVLVLITMLGALRKVPFERHYVEKIPS